MNNPDQYIELCSSHRDRVTYPDASDFEVTLAADGSMDPINFLDGISPEALVVPGNPTKSIPDPWNLYVLNAWQHPYFNDATDGRVSVPEWQTVELRVQLLNMSSDKTTFYVQGIIDSRPSDDGANPPIVQEANILMQSPGAYAGAVISERSIFSTDPPTNNQSTILSSSYIGHNTMVIVTEIPLLSFELNTNFFIQTITRPTVTVGGVTTPPSTGQIFVPQGEDLTNAYEGWYIVNETRQDWRRIVEYDGYSHLVTLDREVPEWMTWDSVSIRVEPPAAGAAVGLDDDNQDMLPSPLNPPGGSSRTIFHLSHLPQDATGTSLGTGPDPRPGDYIEILFGSAISFGFSNQTAPLGATSFTLPLGAQSQLVSLNVGDEIVGLIPETAAKLQGRTRITAYDNLTISFQPPLLAEVVATDQFAIQGGGAKYFSLLVDPANTSRDQILLDVESRPAFDGAYQGMKVLWPTGSSTAMVPGFLSVDRTNAIVENAVGQGSVNDPGTRASVVTDYRAATGILSINPPLPGAPGANAAAGDCSLMVVPFRETRKITKFAKFTGIAESVTETTLVLPARSQPPYRGQASPRDGYYNQLYVSITNYQSSAVAPFVPQFQTRTIQRYDASTRQITFSEPIQLATLPPNPIFEINCGQVDEPFSAPIAIGTITGFRATGPAANARRRARYQSQSQMIRTRLDNNSPLLYSGSMVSQQSAVCYAIRLVSLTVPNAAILGGLGGRIAFYPFLYVRLIHNISSPSRGNPVSFASNNPNAKYETFRVPIDDIPNPFESNFVKLNSNFQTVTVKFRPNDALRVSLHLPNGDLFRTTLPENFPPSIPNPLAQISYCFSIRRIDQ